MAFLPFLVAPNLVSDTLTEGEPWQFLIPPDENPMKKLPKAKRRIAMLKQETNYQVYSGYVGFVKSQRISKTNPPQAQNGIVSDYDVVIPIADIEGYLGAQIPKHLWPTRVEKSLSDKIRLVWNFEKPILLPSPEFANELAKKFAEHLKLAILLPGYDKNSEKPSEMWTNGADWYEIKDEPLSWEYCFGITCEVSKKSSLFQNGGVSLEVIADEIKKRFPGRWKGEFKQDALGVRFWDDKADNPTGCQVKPDGMLCYTGNEPFKKWEDIFGRQWVEEKRVLNLGNAGQGIYFDGRNYYEEYTPRHWRSLSRVDAMLVLKNNGLSDKIPKGGTVSDVERVLHHVQTMNYIRGAAPFINYAPGIIDILGRRILNTTDV